MFSLSSPQEERAGERRPLLLNAPLPIPLPTRASRGEGENFWWLYQDAPLPGRCVGLLFNVIRSLSGDTPELLDSFVESLPCLRPLGIRDPAFARSPKLLDGFAAPKRAGPRHPDGLAAHQHIDRVRVKLWKVSKRDPAPVADFNFQIPIVGLTVCQNLLRR